MDKFKVGDRVCRRKDVYNNTSTMMYGKVIKRYADHTKRFGPYEELYDVQWDSDTVKTYLPHGLDLVEQRE